MRKLTRSGLAAVALLATPLAAEAADVGRPVFKGPVAAPVLLYNWTGVYFGVHAGYGWAEKDWTQTASSFGLPLDASTVSADGFLAGAQIGFNWQMGQWVWGLEGQWSWTDTDGCGGHGPNFPAYASCSEIDWYATIALRLGFAWNNILLYGKGGVAFADETHHITFNFPPPTVDTNRVSDTRTGWMVGAGIEVGFWQNWSAKIEYNYMDFGSENYAFTYIPGGSVPGLVENWDVDQRVHVVKFGINYRFGWVR
jgi:outer membrane immunogenic protein